MLEKTFMVVPRLFFLIVRVQLQRILAFFGLLCQQREVESLDRSCALDGQLFTDALFIFEALDFVTTRTAILLDQ